MSSRSVVVLGASKGIGLAVAKAFFRRGDSVLIVSRQPANLEEAQHSIGGTSSRIASLAADVGDPNSVSLVLETCRDLFGAPEIVVHNCGGPPPGDLLSLTDEDWQSALNQNLLSVVRYFRASAPSMVEREWGRLICVSSTVAREPTSQMTLSSAVRAGVLALVKSLSIGLASSGVTCNSVLPGGVSTERLRALNAARAESEGTSVASVEASSLAAIPIGRFAQPEEVAAAVTFFSSDEASYITGAALSVDGGLTRSI